MRKNKKQIAKIGIFITSIFIIILSISYAFINLTLTGEKRQVITAGTLSLQFLDDSNEISIQNALPMYDEVGMIQDAFTFRLINNGDYATNYKLMLTEIGNGDLAKSDVKYGLIKDGETTIDLLSNLDETGIIDSGIIGASPETIEYELRLWIKDSVTDNSTITGKTLSYRVDVEVAQVVEELPLPFVREQLFATENLGENCSTYNDGIDTFLVGECSNNYVWYSDKLWRVVLKNNETGAVKMITDNSVATRYNASGNTVFKDSYMDQWLNQEFLPTLHDYEEYLVTNSIWDSTADSSSKPARPNGTTTVERTVGLLNVYEYYTTYAASGGLSTYKTGYLNNGAYWWLITPYNTSTMRLVGYDGYLHFENPIVNYGARPVVNLKSTIKIERGNTGNGTYEYPYSIAFGD